MKTDIAGVLRNLQIGLERDVMDRHAPARIIPTNLLALDWALGVGGFPRGRISEIFGPESAGKTSLALRLVRQIQRLGGVAVYFDPEYAVDPAYAAKLGVDVDALVLIRPRSCEQVFSACINLAESGSVQLIVVDSLSALVPQNELDDFDFREGTRRASITSLALPRLVASLARNNCGFVVTNQIRDKVGALFGNPETATGGRALRHFASVRLELRVSQSIKEGDTVIGSRTKLRVVKNKVGPPFTQVESDLLFSHGFCPVGDMLDLGLQHGLVSRNRCELDYRGEVIPGGRESARRFLRTATEVRSRLCRDLRNRLGLPECRQGCGTCLAYCSAVAEPSSGPLKLPATAAKTV